MNKPNFFILGAGKCGTTSLYHYLKQHPDIFIPSEKEPVFFNKGFQVVGNPIDYFKLFSEASGEKRIGEASHAYLTNPSTPELIKLLFSDAKFIVILRNPADRAYSLYNHMKKLGFEKESTFEKALAKEDTRFYSNQFKENCPEYFYNFMYYRSGLYGEQIERYLNFFNKEQFFFTTLNDLKSNPASIIHDLYSFLGVDTCFNPEVKVMNQGGEIARFDNLNISLLYKIRKKIPIEKTGLNFIQRFLIKDVVPLNFKTKERLMAKYKNDMTKLFELTGINVDA